jgi:hypothetical protein
MYHQRQKGSYCRCHAINNLIGRELISFGEFDKLCDEFDKKNHFAQGSSKRSHLFYNYGGVDNIFGYILGKKGISVKMDHYDFYSPKKIKHQNNSTIGYIIYNRGHTYCIRILNGERWLIDSMRGKPQKISSMAVVEKKGTGVICVSRR